MPAQLVEELDESGNVPKGPELEGVTVEPQQEPETPSPQGVLDGDDIPEKYRNKTAAELLEILQNQESHIGRQGQELGDLRNQVGTLRGLVDKSLSLRETGNPGREVETEEDLDDTDFITSPRDAVSKTVQRETRATTDRVARLEQQAAAIDFTRRHPSAETDVEDPQFVDFVKKSNVRTNLAQRAFADPANIDFEAAEELWELYEDYKQLVPAKATEEATSETDETQETSTSQTPEAPKKEAPKMVTSSSSGDQGGSKKPVYSQSALNRLMLNDPETYWSNDTQAKIALAYKEGRVKNDVQ